MIDRPYKVILRKNKTAFITDDEDIMYMKFLPHPDGDPWMTKEGIEITLDNLKIPRQTEWLTNAQNEDVLLLNIEINI